MKHGHNVNSACPGVRNVSDATCTTPVGGVQFYFILFLNFLRHGWDIGNTLLLAKTRHGPFKMWKKIIKKIIGLNRDFSQKKRQVRLRRRITHSSLIFSCSHSLLLTSPLLSVLHSRFVSCFLFVYVSRVSGTFLSSLWACDFACVVKWWWTVHVYAVMHVSTFLLVFIGAPIVF